MWLYTDSTVYLLSRYIVKNTGFYVQIIRPKSIAVEAASVD